MDTEIIMNAERGTRNEKNSSHTLQITGRFEKASITSQSSQEIAQQIVKDILTKKKKKPTKPESKEEVASKEVGTVDRGTKKTSKRQLNVTENEQSRLKERGYTILRQVSKGCSGFIFLAAFSRPFKKDVIMACKVIDKNNVEPKFAAKFLPRELDILSVLHNPYCVNIYAIMEINNKCFVFMRYAERGDLLTYLTTYGALEERHGRMWIRQLLSGLKYLHGLNIAHRDIKCENILITENLNVKIADFGFARYWKDEKGNDTMSETFCGSLSYAAPEILSGRKYSMKKCDIWSLGVVLFIMFNLAKPFTKNKAPQLLQQQLARAYKHKPRVERLLTVSAKETITRMLEPDLLLRPNAETLLSSMWMREDPTLMKLVPIDNYREEVIDSGRNIDRRPMKTANASSNFTIPMDIDDII